MGIRIDGGADVEGAGLGILEELNVLDQIIDHAIGAAAESKCFRIVARVVVDQEQVLGAYVEAQPLQLDPFQHGPGQRVAQHEVLPADERAVLYPPVVHVGVVAGIVVPDLGNVGILVIGPPGVEHGSQAVGNGLAVFHGVFGGVHDVGADHEADVKGEIEVPEVERVGNVHGPPGVHPADGRFVFAVDLAVFVQVGPLEVARQPVVLLGQVGFVGAPRAQVFVAPEGADRVAYPQDVGLTEEPGTGENVVVVDPQFHYLVLESRPVNVGTPAKAGRLHVAGGQGKFEALVFHGPDVAVHIAQARRPGNGVLSSRSLVRL